MTHILRGASFVDLLSLLGQYAQPSAEGKEDFHMYQRQLSQFQLSFAPVALGHLEK
jgi:hypothetical protein